MRMLSNAIEIFSYFAEVNTMSEIKTEIMIHAPIEKVWLTLLDFDSYLSWNPFIQEIKGKPRLGERIMIRIHPPEQKKMVFKPKITSLIDKKELKWIGNLFIPGIFDGHHQFVLNQLEENKVQLIHSEQFSGILNKLIFRLIQNSIRLGFLQMNEAFKQRCETH